MQEDKIVKSKRREVLVKKDSLTNGEMSEKRCFMKLKSDPKKKPIEIHSIELD